MSDYVIETRGLTKTYGGQNSVSNLSIHVRKGVHIMSAKKKTNLSFILSNRIL